MVDLAPLSSQYPDDSPRDAIHRPMVQRSTSASERTALWPVLVSRAWRSAPMGRCGIPAILLGRSSSRASTLRGDELRIAAED